jgi:hypothetical protein
VVLIVLVLLNGSQVFLNPQQITALVEARDLDDPMKRYTADVRCVVQMTGNVQYTTKEECRSIEERIRQMKGTLP